MDDKVINLNALGWFLEDLKELIGSQEIEPLTNSDYNDIFKPAPVPTDWTVLYTEDFGEESGYTPESFANEYGYDTIQEMIEDFDSAASHGSQRWINTGETLEYDGITYEIWEGADNNGSEWESFGYYGLIDPSKKAEIEANTIEVDEGNRYCPFDATVTEDNEIYKDSPEEEGKYCALFVR